MLSIRSSHPDLEEFIDVKTIDGEITGANISIEIDNAFMIAVKEEKEYRLHFTVEDTGEVIEKFVDAKRIYKKIIENNMDWAEPGALYWDRISSYHFMSADPELSFDGVNPCAEEPLVGGGSCLLGSINLSEFVVAPFTSAAIFDFDRFIEAVHDAVHALNDVLDEGLPLHPLEIQRKVVAELRQIGLGIMGLADMFIKLGITYGGTQSLVLSEIISHMMLNEATRTSAMIARDLGSFTRFNYEYIEQSPFFQDNIVPEVQALVKEYGLRNSQLLCIAPTGSIGSMLGISGGLEPEFAFSYDRTTKSLHDGDMTYTVHADIVKEFMAVTGHKDENDLPDYFVSAHDIPWRNRIELQAVWQKHIDASISSTINLGEHITADEVMDIYMYAWEMGLKGCTIYRENCKRGGILVSTKGKKEEKATGYYSTCPECESENMVVSNGCVTCQECGFSPC